MHKFVNNIFKISAAILIIALIIIISFTALCGIFPSKHTDLIHRYCNEYDVDPYLVLSLIKAESNFKTDAVSTADAKGLMQLTQETFEHCMQSLGKSFSDEDIFNPETNINAGVWYLGVLLKKYDGNTQNAVAAYNAGATNVDKWLSDKAYSSDGKTLDEIPFGETARHVKKIDRYYKVYKFLYPDIRR